MMKKLILAIVLLSSPAMACLNDCRMDAQGYALTRSFEGYSPFTYYDIAGVSTIGIGHAIRHGESFDEPLLPPDAQTLLESDMLAKEKAVISLIMAKLSQRQFDALADFTFNVGEGNLRKSTLLKKVNRHSDPKPEFLKWDIAGGRHLAGLRYRRQAEASLYAR